MNLRIILDGTFDSKYNVGRWLENDLEEEPDGMHKEKAPDIV